jgi:hypothetical protein
MKPIIEINKDWALGADPLQWILLRRRKGGQPSYGVSFVSSTKEILARCMQEKSIPPDDAKRALNTLPDTFKQWAQSQLELVTDDKTSPALVPDLPDVLAATSRISPL